MAKDGQGPERAFVSHPLAEKNREESNLQLNQKGRRVEFMTQREEDKSDSGRGTLRKRHTKRLAQHEERRVKKVTNQRKTLLSASRKGVDAAKTH